MHRFRTLTFTIALCVTLWSTTAALAQNTINYAQSILVSLDGNTISSYVFNANPGDQITIHTLPMSPGLQSQITLSGTQGELATAQDSLTHRIIFEGSYTITISPTNNNSGQLALTLNRREPQDAIELSNNQGLLAPLSPDTPTLFFFYPDPANDLTLCIQAETPEVDFGGYLYDGNGSQIASLNHSIPKAEYTIPAEASNDISRYYEVELFPTQPDATGNVVVGLNTCDATTQLDAATTSDTFIPTTPPANNNISIPTTTPSGNTAAEEPTKAITDLVTAEPTINMTNEPSEVVTEPAIEVPLPEATAPVPEVCLDSDGDSVCDVDDFCPDEPGIFEGCPDPNTNGDLPTFDSCPSDPNAIGDCLDTDGDGFHDGVDLCLTVAGPFDGCPDTDGDGFHDGIDRCVEIFSEVLRGCPEDDEDGDGFPNAVDLCEEQSGIFEGCPDSDGDGFHDGIDQCDFSFADIAPGCPDIDGDGVHDGEDLCPDLPIGLAENGRGCPDLRDDDGDGSPNFADECPQQYGSINGCPDIDGDGFPDEQDLCPFDPGPVDGCNDSDQDGRHDGIDECPFDFYQYGVGCPDTDRDGIFDRDDQCVDVRGDAPTGCPDQDGDGIPDASDRCVDIAGDPSLSGCPGINTNP